MPAPIARRNAVAPSAPVPKLRRRWLRVGLLVGAIVLLAVVLSCVTGTLVFASQKRLRTYLSCVRSARANATDPSACVMPSDRDLALTGRDDLATVDADLAIARMVWAGRAQLDRPARDRAAASLSGEDARLFLRPAGAWAAFARIRAPADGFQQDRQLEAASILGDTTQLTRLSRGRAHPTPRAAAFRCLLQRRGCEQLVVAAERAAAHEGGSLDLTPWTLMRAAAGMTADHRGAFDGLEGDLTTADFPYPLAVSAALRREGFTAAPERHGGLARLRIVARALRDATTPPRELGSWLVAGDEEDATVPEPDWEAACGRPYVLRGRQPWRELAARAPLFTTDLEAAAEHLDDWALHRAPRDATSLRELAGKLWLQAALDHVEKLEPAAARRAIQRARERLPATRHRCLVTPLLLAEDFEGADSLARTLLASSVSTPSLERALLLELLAFSLGEQRRFGEAYEQARGAWQLMRTLAGGPGQDDVRTRMPSVWLVGVLAAHAGRDLPEGVGEAGYREFFATIRLPEAQRRAARARLDAVVGPSVLVTLMAAAGAPDDADVEPFLDAIVEPVGTAAEYQRIRLVAARWRDDHAAERAWRDRAMRLRTLVRSDADEVLWMVAMHDGL